MRMQNSSQPRLSAARMPSKQDQAANMRLDQGHDLSPISPLRSIHSRSNLHQPRLLALLRIVRVQGRHLPLARLLLLRMIQVPPLHLPSVSPARRSHPRRLRVALRQVHLLLALRGVQATRRLRPQLLEVLPSQVQALPLDPHRRDPQLSEALQLLLLLPLPSEAVTPAPRSAALPLQHPNRNRKPASLPLRPLFHHLPPITTLLQLLPPHLQAHFPTFFAKTAVARQHRVAAPQRPFRSEATLSSAQRMRTSCARSASKMRPRSATASSK